MGSADSLTALVPSIGGAGDLAQDPGPAPEWLLTDGCGGYASSTPFLCPTRRYHGLLIAPFAGTAKRHVFLARFEEFALDASGARYPLSVAQFAHGFEPRGDQALERFELAPGPVATYRAGSARVRREVRMLRGRHAVLVRYVFERGDGPLRLELRPQLPYREADALTVVNDVLDQAAERIPGGVRCRPYAALPALSLTSAPAAEFDAEPTWTRGVVFAADRARGYDGHEDEFSPGVLRATLAPGEALVVAASSEAPVDDPAAAWRAAEDGDPPAAAVGFGAGVGLAGAAGLDATVARGADDFLYRTPEGRLGVIAGFPWFLEWGRDTFLSLPGLTLARGDLGACAEVLTGALPFLRDGLLPNIFGTGVADSHYGSADAALWFGRAVLLYTRAGGDERLVRRTLLPALESIAAAYLDGTELGLFVDEAGLLHAGSPELNPTWMDAQVAAGPVTPRHGCPVEIAALWCSLLGQLDELAGGPWGARRARAGRTFHERFWDAGRGQLADVWRDGERDWSVRPNMVLAAALELAPLSREQRRAIVARADEALVTPRGLRTLAPTDPAYIGRYTGGSEERDGAYHQGTVWPWLLGPYVEATLRAYPGDQARSARLQALLAGLAPELDRAGLEHLSEVFDGDAPHTPGGAIAQAWNTAEWLRARQLLAKGRA